jgi:hypothetical protein
MSDEGALANLSLKVYEGTRLVATLPVWRTTEIGRREPSEPPPFARIKRSLPSYRKRPSRAST